MDTKICSKCKLELATSAFDKSKFYKDGYRGQCRNCRRLYCTEYNKNTRDRSRDRPVDPRYSRSKRLKWSYGIDIHQFEAMVAEQSNRCAICDKHASETLHGKLSIDHCHKTGRIRGLLCPGCNAGIGHFGDDPSRLAKASKYLS